MRYQLEYLLVGLSRVVLRFLPRSLVSASGTIVGWLFYTFGVSRRRQALANLAEAFPDQGASERQKIARSVFAHFGRHLFDLLKLGMTRLDQLLETVEFEGEDIVERAYAQGRGVIFYSGHFGYWELWATAHALRFNPITLIARPLDNPRLETLLADVRTRSGNAVIPRSGAVRGVLRELMAKRGVALLIDQHTNDPSAVCVRFFNRPAWTTAAIAMLALRTGAPVIPIFSIPLPGGRCRFVYEPAVEPPNEQDPNAVCEFTQRCTDILEIYVRRHPNLWLWMHRRWRDTNLDGENWKDVSDRQSK